MKQQNILGFFRVQVYHNKKKLRLNGIEDINNKNLQLIKFNKILSNIT